MHGRDACNAQQLPSIRVQRVCTAASQCSAGIAYSTPLLPLSFCAQDDPPETELKAGLDLLGPVDDIFFDSYDIYEPTNDWQKDNCIISKVRRGAARGRGGAGHCTVRCTALGLTCC